MRRLGAIVGASLLSICGAFSQESHSNLWVSPAWTAYQEALVEYRSDRLNEAEARCKAALEIYNYVGTSAPAVHTLLSRINLRRGNIHEAYREAIDSWKPGRDPLKDMLVLMAGARIGAGRPKELSMSSFVQLLNRHPDYFANRIGGYINVPTISNCDYWSRQADMEREAAGILLYVADPEVAASEKLEMLDRLERLFPHTAAAAYWRGMAFASLNRTPDAMKNLGFAEAAGKGMLPQMAHQALQAIRKPG